LLQVLVWKGGNTVPEESWRIPGYCFDAKLAGNTRAAQTPSSLNSYLRQLQKKL